MSGLTNEEVSKSNILVRIPANPEYSSLNLAAAVQVFCGSVTSASEAQDTGRNYQQLFL